MVCLSLTARKQIARVGSTTQRTFSADIAPNELLLSGVRGVDSYSVTFGDLVGIAVRNPQNTVQPVRRVGLISKLIILGWEQVDLF